MLLYFIAIAEEVLTQNEEEPVNKKGEDDIRDSSDDEVDRLFKVDDQGGPCIQMELGYVSYESDIKDEDFILDTL